MVTIPGEGALGDVITQMETAILKLEGDEIVFKDKLRIPKKPMIGVIGVAPESGAGCRTGHRSHGGNLHCHGRQGNSALFHGRCGRCAVWGRRFPCRHGRW